MLMGLVEKILSSMTFIRLCCNLNNGFILVVKRLPAERSICPTLGSLFTCRASRSVRKIRVNSPTHVACLNNLA